MHEELISAEVDREPFLPLFLQLIDGSEVEVPVPYLSFINRRSLYIAQAIRRGSAASDGSGAQLIPLANVKTIRRSIEQGQVT